MALVYYVACSLDGFIAPPGGDVSWLKPFEETAEDYGYLAFYKSVGELIMGSRTYERALTFDTWPFAGKPTHVLSSRPLVSTRPDVSVTSTNLAPLVRQIRSRGERATWLVGGGAVAGSAVNERVLDEVIVTYVPRLLGRGVALFQGVTQMHSLHLIASRSYPNGVVQLQYRLAYA